MVGVIDRLRQRPRVFRVVIPLDSTVVRFHRLGRRDDGSFVHIGTICTVMIVVLLDGPNFDRQTDNENGHDDSETSIHDCLRSGNRFHLRHFTAPRLLVW